MQKAYLAYNEIGLSTDVMSASGHRLIQLLIDKCLQNIEEARACIASKQIENKHKAIIKTLNIVDYLRACLNHKDENVKELSGLLESLYAYLQQNLVRANIQNNTESLDEAKKVLVDIKEGWDGIQDKIA